MRYAQKKSFSLFAENGGGEGRVETYLSNIGLKLMLLSVAIRYFYCSRLCIIFLSHPTPLISSRSAISPPLPIILLGLILISMPPRWGNHPVLRHLNVPPPPPPRFIYVSRFLNGGWRAVAHYQASSSTNGEVARKLGKSGGDT